MRDPRKEYFLQKQAHSIKKPRNEEPDPFADLIDESEMQRLAKTGICKTPSWHVKQAADKKLKTERSLRPSEAMEQLAEKASLIAKGEEVCGMSQPVQVDREMPSQKAPNHDAGVFYT